MNTLAWFAFALSATVPTAFAGESFPAQNYSRSEICSREGSNCEDLHDDKGREDLPDFQKETREYVLEHGTNIKQIADWYGVSEVALAGVILAENALNTHPINLDVYLDKLHVLLCEHIPPEKAEIEAGHAAYIEAMKTAKFITIFKKHPSMGIGAVKVEAAMSVEKLVEDNETRRLHLKHRLHRNRNEVIEALNTPSLALPYIAALLAKGVAAYGPYWNLKGHLEIQATLFNLGNQDHVADLNAGAERPMPNYLGYYVYKKQDEIQELLNTPYHPSKNGVSCEGVPDEERDRSASEIRGDALQRDLNRRVDSFLSAFGFTHHKREYCPHGPRHGADTIVYCRAENRSPEYKWQWQLCTPYAAEIKSAPASCEEGTSYKVIDNKLFVTQACTGSFMILIEDTSY